MIERSEKKFEWLRLIFAGALTKGSVGKGKK